MSSRLITPAGITLAVLTILGSLAMVLPIALRLSSPEGPTAARTLRSVGTDHAQTCGNDMGGLGLIVVNDVAWAPCSADTMALPRGGVARIDPEEGVIDLRAAIPSGAPPWFEALGVLPNSDGARVAFAYRIGVPEGNGSRPGGIAILIAREGGLWRAPVEIHADVEAQLLGMGWDDDVLEVAMRGPGTREESLAGPIAIARVAREGEVERTEIPLASVCRDLTSCWTRGAYRAGGAWRFVLSGISPETRTWIWSAGLDGAREPIGAPRAERSYFDLGAAGMLIEGALDHVGFVLSPDGRIVASEDPPPMTGRRIALGQYEWAEGRVRPRIRYVDPQGRSVAQRIGERTVVASLEPGPPPWVSVDGTAVAMPAWGQGGRLHHGALLPRRGGGFYLADVQGASIALDANGERADPLGAFEHVYQVSPGAYTQLWFLLLGLPLFVVLGTSVAAILRRRTAFGIALGALAGSVLFLAVAFAWALDHVYDALP